MMKGLFRTAQDMARLMVGQPNYQVYLAHMAQAHPDKQPMTRLEFFRDREKTRYGGKGTTRCC